MNAFNIPKHKNCKNCGKCCGIMPATVSEVNTIRNYIAVNGIFPIERVDRTICPFRDNESKKCLIYPVRPVICRLFGVAKGCMEYPNGNSAEIDGKEFLRFEKIKILNFEKW